MKFDTPAGPNPIDRMKVVGQAARPLRRAPEDDRHGDLCLRVSRHRAERRLRLRPRRRDRQGADRVDRHGQGAGGSRRGRQSSPTVTPDRSGSASSTSRRCSPARRSTIIISRSPSSSPRRSSRRAPRRALIRVDYARAQRRVRSRRSDSDRARPAARSVRRPDRDMRSATSTRRSPLRRSRSTRPIPCPIRRMR